jgi:NAD(P)-dependent dehydrogenase (short-subunit alcohol dehydrogenase family)
MKQVVITGVSSGIGYGCARVLVDRGVRVFGSVRRESDAERLQRELGDLYVPLLFDITDEVAVQRAAETVARHLGTDTLDGLVNNAGIEVAGPLAYLPTDQFRHQLEVNLVGPMIVTKAFLPLLGVDPARTGNPGRIVNISSTSAKIAGPFGGAYAASKFGLEGYSESLRRELILFGIDVILIRPGFVQTAIWEKAESGVTERFRDTPYAESLAKFESYGEDETKGGLPPEAIGKAVWRALTAARHPVHRAIVKGRLTNWTIPQLLPMRLLDRLAAQFFGIRRQEKR